MNRGVSAQPAARAAAPTRTIHSRSPEQTSRIGEQIGQGLRAGDVLLLRGDLGAGKTQFARGVAAGLMIPGPIPSPTFTLVNEYDGRDRSGARVPLAHIDLYRLGDGGDLDSLGLDDYLGGAWAVVIEWPERAADDGFVPPTYLDVALVDTGASSRTLVFTVHGDAVRLLDLLGTDAP